jgi:hypothetical protein
MDFKRRIELFDKMKSLSAELKMPEKKVAALTTFLAKLPDEQRESILEFIGEADSLVRFERFADLATLEPALQAEQLKAFGIQVPSEPLSKIDKMFESACAAATKGLRGVIDDVTEKASKENIGSLIWNSFAQKLKKWAA